MAVYLPGPPIYFPPPPPPKLTMSLKSAAVTKSSSKTTTKFVDDKYQVLILINPTEADVEFTVGTTKSIKLGKSTLDVGDKKSFKVKPKELFNISFINPFWVKPEHLKIKENAGKKATYNSTTRSTRQ